MGTLFTRVTSAVSLGTILASTLATSVAGAVSEFLPYAETLATNGVINVQPNEAGYRLADSITRGEMAKIAVNLAGVIPTGCLGTMYSDVTTSNTLCAYVEAAADAGIVSSAFANFRPSALVTRAEMTKMLLAAVGQSPSATSAGYMDVPESLGDLAGYINAAYELGCARAATYYRPNANSSRGEAFKIAACVAGIDTTTEPPVVPPVTGTGVVPPTSSGALVVSLSGSAVAPQYVPRNASSVNVGTVALTAGPTPVTVQSMVIERSGLGNANDVETNGIRAAVNGMIISSTADYYNPTSQKATVYFSPALVIPANTSVPVSVLVSLSGADNSQHKFSVKQVNASNTVVSGAPVDLGFVNTTSYVVALTTYTVTNQSSVIPGKTQQKFATVEVTAGNRDTTVHGFTLTRSGASDLTKRFANVGVYKNAVKVGTVSIVSDKIYVTGIASTLLAGNTETYELRGDILVDATSSSVQLRFDSTSDGSASEVATGYATRSEVYSNGTISFGNIEVTFVKTSTGTQTVAPGTNNVTLFAGRVTSGVPLSVRQLVITPNVTGSGIDAFVNNILSVRLNGSEVASLTSLSGVQSLPVSFVIDPLTPANITIVGNVKSSSTMPVSNHTYTVQLSDVRDMNNNPATLGAGSQTSGDKTTIATATLTLKNATISAPSSSRIYSSAEQEIGRFALTAANEAARLTDLVVVNTGTMNLQNAAISTASIKLVDVDTNSDVSASVSIAGNTATFSSMNYVIGKDITKNFKIVLNTTSLEDYYGSGIQLTLNSGSLTAVRDLNGTALTVVAGTLLGSATMKAYSIGPVPPTVLVAKTSDLNKYLVTIRNIDSNTGITLSGITVRFQYRYTGQGTSTITGTICLRDQGESVGCGGSGTTAGTPVASVASPTFFSVGVPLTTNPFIDKNTGTVTYEIYLDPEPLFVAGDFTQAAVTRIDYMVGMNSYDESYVGVSGASATASK